MNLVNTRKYSFRRMYHLGHFTISLCPAMTILCLAARRRSEEWYYQQGVPTALIPISRYQGWEALCVCEICASSAFSLVL